jgi:hypothetical protein
MRIKDAEEGQCKASITFSPHADVNDGVEPEETEPTLEDDFDYEDTPNEYGTVEDGEQMERPGDGPWKDFALDGDNPDVRRYKRLNHDQNPKIAIENKLYELQTEGRITRMTGSELHNLIKESVKKILKEENSPYRGIYIQGLGLPEEWLMRKIDWAFDEKGYSPEQVQWMVDWLAHETSNDENYRY